MNDFSDLESQLKALRPSPMRDEFVAKVEEEMSKSPAATNVASEKIITPLQFRRHWYIGLGLAAAAAVLLLVRVNFQTANTPNEVTSASPAASAGPVQVRDNAVQNTFVPAGTTQVVYHKRDEGLLFANNGDPLRRYRSLTRETLQWRNPATGASLQVTYPSEKIELVPVSGQ